MSVFISINPPSATDAQALGINASGQIVGFTFGGNSHGFLYSGETYTTVDVPGALSTEADGINDFGHIVGTYFSAGKFHGYIYRNGTFTTLDDPLGTTETVPQGINNADQVVGFYLASTGAFHGFFVDAAFGLYAPDRPSARGHQRRRRSGDVCARYQQCASDRRVLRRQLQQYPRLPLTPTGSYTTLDDPFGHHGTRALGINDAGQIVGYYYDASGHARLPLQRRRLHHPRRSVGRHDAEPGTYAASASTMPARSSATYVDGSGNFHGFLETGRTRRRPPAPPPT